MVAQLNILAGEDKGRSFELEDDKTYLIGRDSENDIEIKDRYVSRVHLKIKNSGSKYVIEDLKSKNGSFINGVEVEPGTTLEVDPEYPIVIGTTILNLDDALKTWLKPFLNSIDIWYQNNISGKPLTANKPNMLKMILKYLYNFNKSLDETGDIDDIIENTLDIIFNLTIRPDRCALIRLDEGTGKVSNVAFKSKNPDDTSESVYNPQLIERALMLKKEVYISNPFASNYGEGDEVVDTLRLMKVKSAICIPMKGNTGIIGAIYIDSLDSSHGFGKAELALLNDICNCASKALADVVQSG